MSAMPRGRERVLSLVEVARAHGKDPEALRGLLAKEEWIRLAPLSWASLASTNTVRVRHFDRADDQGRLLPVRE